MSSDPSVSAYPEYDVEATNKTGRPQLYKARTKIHPKRASGTFRRFKWIVMAVTLGIYYLTPFIRWDRGPYAPDQAVLIDLANKRFYFFAIEIWPHEFFYVAGMLVMAGVALFLVTSTVGRAWCGYACPQTVWVDLFLVVERFFEGDRNARLKLDKAPWSVGKLAKRVAKHATWLVIAVATGGAWIFYFADAPTLAADFIHVEAAAIAYGTVAVLTFTTYTLGGLMREQVCLYMCPWPRVQGAMLDETSLTVTYNDWRGEPQGKHRKKLLAQGEPVGDCVDCRACVAVCPMGIDIRDGQQFECITCALCIDACDSVMDKLGLEKGLISYSTLGAYDQNMEIAGATLEGHDGLNNWNAETIMPDRVRDAAGKLRDGFASTNWRILIRPRNIIYLAVYAAIGLGMLAVLAGRDRLDVSIRHDRNPQFVQLSDGSIRNGFELGIQNMRQQPVDFEITIPGLANPHLRMSNQVGPGGDNLQLTVDASEHRKVRLFVTIDRPQAPHAAGDFEFLVRDIQRDIAVTKSARFEVPDHLTAKETRNAGP